MAYLIRAVILLILGWLAYRFIRRLFYSDSPAPSLQKEKVEMVPCEHCGVHIPKPEALSRNGRFYCSPEHLETDKY